MLRSSISPRIPLPVLNMFKFDFVLLLLRYWPVVGRVHYLLAATSASVRAPEALTPAAALDEAAAAAVLSLLRHQALFSNLEILQNPYVLWYHSIPENPN